MTYLKTGEKKDCCGCGSCYNVCNHKAIEMVTDEEGFLFPKKNKNCVNCGLCENVCPYELDVISKKDSTLDYPKTYAAYSPKERKYSSSGGVFYELAREIINQNGTIYGAAFDNAFKLRHFAVNSLEDLNPLRGSKYLQSNTGLCFKEIKNKVVNNELVLFVGTPCQVAGLKCYLKHDYPSLFTVDVVCHGVPSQWLFDQHKAYLEKKYKASLKEFHFRDNNKWGGCEIAIFTNRKKIVNPTYELSPYLYSFMYGYTFRWSCYECPFSKIPRLGELTLGDYWGVKRVFPNVDSKGGVSVVLVNNKKGESLFNRIKESLFIRESCLTDACKENGNITHHSEVPEIRKRVFQLLSERGYADLAKKEFRSPKYKSLKRKLYREKYIISPLAKLYRQFFKK